MDHELVAEVPSHQLMIRAGFIRKLASGTYTYLPLGYRSLMKIIAIIRSEMNAAGAQEILMPILQPLELWQQTGRDTDYGPTMCKFEDRHGRWNALAPTAEEVVTSLVAGEVNSYKQLPVNLYQINTKFRDEFRPRFGVLRSREFIMKDAYSFHANLASLDETYRLMYDAYVRIFKRSGLIALPVEAESGPIGGSASHEFMVPCSAGEDTIVHTEDYSYAANIEKAEVDAVPRAPQAGGTQLIAPMKGIHTPGVGTIEAVTKFLGVAPHVMIKTLVYVKHGTFSADKFAKMLEDERKAVQQALRHKEEMGEPFTGKVEIKLQSEDKIEAARGAAAFKKFTERMSYLGSLQITVVLVRGDHEVNEAKLDRIAGGTFEMAPPELVKFLTGADIGFAGPHGAAEAGLRLVVDHSVAAMAAGVAGANKTDFHVTNVVPGRNFPLAGPNVVVADVRNAVEGDTRGGKPLKFSRGIEVGHVFKLGTKYSEKLNARFSDENQQSQPCIMGCYGIGVNRIFASAIEMSFDANGCVLPINIAPFEVEVVSLGGVGSEVMAQAQRIHDELSACGIEVLLDDRDARPGVKFKDADLLGIPLRITVGEKGLKEGKVEIKRRTDAKATLVNLADAVPEARRIVEELKTALA